MSCPPEILKESRASCAKAIESITQGIKDDELRLEARKGELAKVEKQATCLHEEFDSPSSMGYNTDTCLECGWQYSY